MLFSVCRLKNRRIGDAPVFEEAFALHQWENSGKIEALHHIAVYPVEKFRLLWSLNALAKHLRARLMHESHYIGEYGLLSF